MSEEGYESGASMSFFQIFSYPFSIYALGTSCSGGGMIWQHPNMVTQSIQRLELTHFNYNLSFCELVA